MERELPAASAVVEIEIAGRAVRFLYPEAPGLRPFVESVLAGGDYPLVFPGRFQPRTIVDVGAHAGAATVYLKAHYPEARVWCFEPSSLNHEYLLANVAGLADVTTAHVALSDAPGEARLYAGCYSSMQQSLKPNPENGEEYERVAVRDAASAFAEVPFDGPVVLKLDTEGCELEILCSARAFLPRIDVIYLEYHSEVDRLEIDRLLAPRFTLFHACAGEPHRGTNTYVATRVLESGLAQLEQRYVWPKDGPGAGSCSQGAA